MGDMRQFSAPPPFSCRRRGNSSSSSWGKQVNTLRVAMLSNGSLFNFTGPSSGMMNVFLNLEERISRCFHCQLLPLSVRPDRLPVHSGECQEHSYTTRTDRPSVRCLSKWPPDVRAVWVPACLEQVNHPFLSLSERCKV